MKHGNRFWNLRVTLSSIPLLALCAGGAVVQSGGSLAPEEREGRLLQMLDAPLLFVKRHSYTGIHIYDTYYKWPPGGGASTSWKTPSRPARNGACDL